MSKHILFEYFQFPCSGEFSPLCPPPMGEGLRNEIYGYVAEFEAREKAREKLLNLLPSESFSSEEVSIFSQEQVGMVQSDENVLQHGNTKSEQLRSITPKRHFVSTLNKTLSCSICLALISFVCFFAWRPTNSFLEANVELNGSETIQSNIDPYENRRSLSCQRNFTSGISLIIQNNT